MMLIRNLASLFFGLFILSACSDEDAPAPENEEETITTVTLQFSPKGGGNPLSISWNDPDGDSGPQVPGLSPDTLQLAANTTYTLSLSLVNDIAGEDITTEIDEEANEHLFFFGWTDALFSAPEGDGNIDNRLDAVNYLDSDLGGLPLGLETEWTTADAGTEGSLRILLKHQPGQKSETSTSTTGSTDLNINIPIKNI